MAEVTSRELVHNFSALSARVAAGEELTVTRHGKPLLKLVQVPPSELGAQERQMLVQKALSFRMSRAFGGKFKRNVAYDA